MNAAIVASSMVCLIGILGIRAYLVADSHSSQIRELSEQDMRAQNILDRIESVSSSQRQAARKFSITRDPAYQRLAVHEQITLRNLTNAIKELLTVSHPELLPAQEILSDRAGIQRLREALESRRKDRLYRAEQEASGLLRLIFFALLLSIGIAAWLLYFFYRGLMLPLRSLSEATGRIRAGELSFRIPSSPGVAELRELCGSFNLMAERLESLEVAKAEFLAMISHEFKNPLAALKEGLSLLVAKEETLSPSGREKTFAACVIASKRLESMMNNLLMNARAENGLFKFDIVPKDLRPAIDMAIQETGPLAAKRGMSIRFQQEGELQAAFNFDGLVHALENLMINAIKYGAEKSVIDVQARPIERALARANGAPIPFVEISISNMGKPVSAVELTQVFDRFYRGAGSTDPQGLGLGLHVVKKIIEAHHGNVSARSSEGRTVFTIQVPSSYDSSLWKNAEAEPRKPVSRPARAPLSPRPSPWSPMFLFLAAAPLILGAGGCASILHRNEEGPAAAPAPAQLLISQASSIESLERELAEVSTRWVSIPTHSLRSILSSERSNRNQCKALSGKLEAIKSIDLEKKGDVR